MDKRLGRDASSPATVVLRWVHAARSKRRQCPVPVSVVKREQRAQQGWMRGVARAGCIVSTSGCVAGCRCSRPRR